MNSSLNISNGDEPALNVVFQAQLSAKQIREIVYFTVLSEGEKYQFSLDNFNKLVALIHFTGMPITDITRQMEQKYTNKGLFLANELATEICLKCFGDYMPTVKLGFKNEC